MRLASFVLAITLAIVFTHLAASQETSALAEDAVAAFAWIDTIDDLDTSKLPYGRASTGHWFQEFGSEPQNTYFAGFLLRDDGTTFVVRGVDLERRTFRRNISSKPEERVDFEPRDFASDVRVLAERIRGAARNDHELRGYHEPGKTVRPIPAAVLLARACARRGLTADTADLCSAIRGRKGEPEGSLLGLLRDELATSLWYQAISAVADRSRSRGELVEIVKRYRALFPGSDFAKESEALRAGLESLLAEDARRGVESRESRPESQRASTDPDVEEGVHALRDQFEPGNLSGWSSLDYLGMESRPSPDSPAARLAALGFRAVPRLIDSMSDSRPSRCVWYSSRFGGSFGVTPIGGIATEVVEKILGVRVEGSPEKARTHFARVRRGDELYALGDAVAVGDWWSGDVARQLIARYPDRALPFVIKGARASKRGCDRAQLVTIAAEMKAPEITAFLLDELKSSPFLGSRVAAAFALRARGRHEGLPAMIQAWTESANRPKADPFSDMELMVDDSAVFRFLVSSGSTDALRAIAAVAQRNPPAGNSILIEAVTAWPEDTPADPELAADRKRAKVILEELLVHGLDDEREINGTVFHQYNGVVFDLVQPRVSDEFAWALAALRPDRYRFESTVPRRQRDWQIATIRNQWREANGLAPMVVADSRAVDELSPSVVTPLLDGLAAAGAAGERKPWIARLEALGPAALGLVTVRAATLPPDSDARKDLDALARRLACTVAVVKIVDETKETRADLREQLEALKGKVLDSHGVIRTFVVAIDRTLTTSGGVRLDVERSVESPGVVVSLRVLAKSSNGDGCSHGFAARIGCKQMGFSGGSGIAEVWRSEPDFEDEQDAIERVLAAPVDQSFEIHLERGIR